MPPAIKEITLAEQVLRLIYPPAIVKSPLTVQLLSKFSELSVNILRSEVNATKGWLEVQFVGTPGLIEVAIDWLRQQEVEVQVLSA